MTVETEVIAWVLVFMLAMTTLIFGVANAVDSPKAVCSCTECVYSAGSTLKIVVKIGDERYKVSGSVPVAFTCDKVGGE